MNLFWLELKRLLDIKRVFIFVSLLIFINIYHINTYNQEYASQLISKDYLKIAQQKIHIEEGVKRVKEFLGGTENYNESNKDLIHPIYHQTYDYIRKTIDEELFFSSSSYREMRIKQINEQSKDADLNIDIVHENAIARDLILGYAEGWTNINKTFSEYLYYTLIIISVILNYLYTEDFEKDILELIAPSKLGMSHLIRERFYIGLIISTILYLCSIFIMLSSRAIYFGITGYDLLIQSNESMSFASTVLTYSQQSILLIIFGLCVTMFFSAIVMVLSKVSKGVFRGLIYIFILFAISHIGQIYLLADKIMLFKILPREMIEIQKYFRVNSFIQIFGYNIPNIILTIGVTLIGLGLITMFFKLLTKND